MAAFIPMGAENELVSGLGSQWLSESSLAGSLGLMAEGTQLLLVAKLESPWSVQSMRCGIVPASSAHPIRGQRTGWQWGTQPLCVCAALLLGCYEHGGQEAAPLGWMVPHIAGHLVALALPLDACATP